MAENSEWGRANATVITLTGPDSSEWGTANVNLYIKTPSDWGTDNATITYVRFYEWRLATVSGWVPATFSTL